MTAAPATLVIGGSGRTGRRIVERLLARGLHVRTLGRRPPPTTAARLEAVQGDIRTLRADALAGVRGVVVSVEPPSDAAGADAVLNRAVADLAARVARTQCPIVLLSQIYITRPDAYPQMRDVILARGRGEQALRDSGARYVIVRPGWLTDAPSNGALVTQGDTLDGRVSRDTVAEACVHALLAPDANGRTFEIFDAAIPDATPVDWAASFAGLKPDSELTYDC